MDGTTLIVVISLAAFGIGLFIVGLLSLFIRKQKPAARPAAAWDGQERRQQEVVVRVENVPVPAAPVVVPAAPQQPVNLFALTRLDIIGFVNEMKKDGERYSIIPLVKEKSENKLPDYLMCGERCFAIMFEHGEYVFNLLLHMGAAEADKYAAKHTLKLAAYLGDDWYNLIVDNSFTDKQEIFNMLDVCYFHAALRYMTSKKEKKGQKADAEAAAAALAEAQARQAEIEKQATANMAEITAAAEEAEKQYRALLATYEAGLKSGNYVEFMLTRKEIAQETQKRGGEAVTIVERADAQLPMSLKYGPKTFAMLYGTDAGIVMTARISDGYAAELFETHPAIRPAKFPRRWYQIIIDGTFKDKESVFAVLTEAANYVKESSIAQNERKAAEAEARAAARAEKENGETA